MPALADRLGIPRQRYAARYGFTGLIRALGTGLFYPFSLIYFHRQLGAPLAQIGTCLTGAGLIAALGVVHTGRLVDRFGARNVMVGATLTRAAVFLMYPLIHHLGVFAVLATVMTLGYRTDQVAGQALVRGLAPRGQSASWLALSRMTLNAGIGVGAMAGGLLLASQSHGSLLVIANAIAFAAVAAISMTFPAVGERAPGAGGNTRVWRDGLFMCVAVLNGLWLLVGLAVEVGLPIYLVIYLHTRPVFVSMMVVLNTSLVFLLQLPIGRVIRDRPVMRMFATGLCAYTVAFGILFVTRGTRGSALIAALLVAICAFTLGEMLVAICGMVTVNQLAPPGQLGSYVGVSQLFAGLGGAVAPALFTVGLQLSPGGLWLVLAGLGVVMTALSLRLQGRVSTRIGQTQPERTVVSTA